MRLTILLSIAGALGLVGLLKAWGITEIGLNFYTFNVITLALTVLLLTFSFGALLIVDQEKRALRRERGKSKRNKIA